MVHRTLQQRQVNCQQSAGGPTFPDDASFGTSRIGKKLIRKALDAYYVASRRYEGRPAKSGPPVAGSEKNGRREFYSLEQVRLGGIRSGATRRRQAQLRWNDVASLTIRGFGIREISRIVGYSAGWVSRLIKRLFSKQPRVLPEHSFHYTVPATRPRPVPATRPRPVPATRPTVWATRPRPVWATHGSRLLTLATLYRHTALQAVLHGEHLDDPQERNRRGRQFALSQARIIGRRGKRPSKGLLGALGEGSVALGMALLARRELDGLPIVEAVQVVNQEFGWQQKGRW